MPFQLDRQNFLQTAQHFLETEVLPSIFRYKSLYSEELFLLFSNKDKTPGNVEKWFNLKKRKKPFRNKNDHKLRFAFSDKTSLSQSECRNSLFW
jgi:hypothetical protein